MFHKEGYTIIGISCLVSVVLLAIVWLLIPELLLLKLLSTTTVLVFLVLILQFFRNPARPIPLVSADIVYAPADGKVVVIEEAFESEILGQKCIQISIFMSPLNVHVNRHAVSGTISYYRYHPGAFLVAWHPKSSTDNERTTIVYELPNGKKVLVRQIAGFVARRIICYAKEGAEAKQGGELGFIRFGSRVDIFLPTDANIQAKIGDVTVGNQSVLALLQQ